MMKMKMLIFPWLFSMASFCGLGWTEWRRKNIELSQTDLIEYPKTSRKWMTSTDKCGLTISKGDLSTVGIQDFCWAIAPIFFGVHGGKQKNLPFKAFEAHAAGMASHRCLGEEAAVIRYVWTFSMWNCDTSLNLPLGFPRNLQASLEQQFTP